MKSRTVDTSIHDEEKLMRKKRAHELLRRSNIVDNSRKRSIPTLLIIIATLASVVTTSIVIRPSLSQSASGNATVIGTKEVYISESRLENYLFRSNTTLVIRAPFESGWTFERTEIDFGSETCTVAGVAGSNVSKILSVNGGKIQEWAAG